MNHLPCHLLVLPYLLATFVTLGCAQQPVAKPLPAAITVASTDTLAQQSKRIVELMATGDYAGAIAAIEASPASEAEKKSATGRLILDGAVDPGAKTRPGFTVDEGLSRLESAAQLGSDPGISDLLGFFTVGLSNRGENVQLVPSAELANCWKAAQSQAAMVNDCIAMRKRLQLPKR